jgi:hypothetical protein
MIRSLTALSLGALTSISALSALPANAQYATAYYSPAPTPTQTPSSSDFQYIAKNVDGVKFYNTNPFYSARTPDGNLFVSSIIAMRGNGLSTAAYLQFDCGRLRYRNLTPWVSVDRAGRTNNDGSGQQWRNIVSGSAFELTGKYLCETAAGDRGMQWVWYR